MTIILPQLLSCQALDKKETRAMAAINMLQSHETVNWQRIENIPTPPGYKRIAVTDESFSAWLRAVPLKKDNRVFLYNGSLKPNQSAQFAVLDIPVGKKDLQQCADAIMRLRAQFLFDKKRFGEISFADNKKKNISTCFFRQAHLKNTWRRCSHIAGLCRSKSN